VNDPLWRSLTVTAHSRHLVDLEAGGAQEQHEQVVLLRLSILHGIRPRNNGDGVRFAPSGLAGRDAEPEAGRGQGSFLPHGIRGAPKKKKIVFWII